LSYLLKSCCCIRPVLYVYALLVFLFSYRQRISWTLAVYFLFKKNPISSMAILHIGITCRGAFQSQQ